MHDGHKSQSRRLAKVGDPMHVSGSKSFIEKLKILVDALCHDERL